MKKVEMYISNGCNDHRFIINAETVYEGDVIANYVHKPFSYWRDNIMQELYENCNGEFCIYLSSGIDEYEYLENIRKSFPKCSKIIWNGETSRLSGKKESSYEESNDIWGEIERIYKDIGTSLATTKKIIIGLCIGDEAMTNYTDIFNSIIKVGFSTVKKSLKCPYFNFIIEEIEKYDFEYFEGISIYVGDRNNAPNEVIVLSEYLKIGNQIKGIIEERYLKPFVEINKDNTFKMNEIKQGSDVQKSMNLSINIPDKIDIGKSKLIGIVGMPKIKALEFLYFEMSEPEILKYDRGRLYAVAPGTVEVRVKVKGKIEPIKRCMVETVQHTYVQSIELPENGFLGTVGEVYQIKPKFLPQNAENTAEIKYESMNTRIAAVSTDGLVELLSTGKTKIRISVENVELFFSVDSKLRITKIVVSNEVLKLSVGDKQPLYIYIEPPCYDADFLDINIDNEDVITYEKGMIQANAIGEANMIIKSPNSSSIAKVQITVISSNYILARRALETSNFVDAARYYEQIRMEYPNDWEANFFAVYARAYKVEATDISRSMELIMNNLDITFSLIFQTCSDEEMVNVVTLILKYIAQITQEMASKASQIHSMTRIGQEHLNSRAECTVTRHNCATVAYVAAYKVECAFAESYQKVKQPMLNIWKLGVAIDVQTLQYAVGRNWNILQSDITAFTQKIREYEPTYNAPRPTGGDSSFLDYVSIFL